MIGAIECLVVLEKAVVDKPIVAIQVEDVRVKDDPHEEVPEVDLQWAIPSMVAPRVVRLDVVRRATPIVDPCRAVVACQIEADFADHDLLHDMDAVEVHLEAMGTEDFLVLRHEEGLAEADLTEADLVDAVPDSVHQDSVGVHREVFKGAVRALKGQVDFALVASLLLSVHLELDHPNLADSDLEVLPETNGHLANQLNRRTAESAAGQDGFRLQWEDQAKVVPALAEAPEVVRGLPLIAWKHFAKCWTREKVNRVATQVHPVVDHGQVIETTLTAADR